MFLGTALLGCQTGMAQIGNNWAFGKFAGIDFGQDPPQTFLTQMHYIGYLGSDTTYSTASSSISDCNGNLLFYFNGCKVWDSTHQIMNNGNLIKCFGKPFTSYIIPKPGTDKQYYLFYDRGGSATHDFFYSVIDMSKGSGKGKVIQKDQPIKQPNNATGYLTVVEHQNNQDYWLVILSYSGSYPNFNYTFYAYPVTQTGLGTPVTTNVNLYSNTLNYTATLKATPNGEHLLVKARWDFGGKTFMGLRFDFNKSNGQVSNKQGLITTRNASDASLTGIATSPNNELIYLRTGHINYPPNYYRIFQVKNRKSKPYQTALNVAEPADNGDMQLAANDKIYYTMPVNGDYDWLGAIHKPNVRGKGCNVQDNVINLAPNRAGTYNLPRLYQPTPDIDFKVSDTCKDTVRFTNLTDTTNWDSVRRHGFVWKLGDGTTDTAYHTKHVYDTPGTYHVRLKGLNECNKAVWQSDSITIHEPLYPGFRIDSVATTCQKGQFFLTDTAVNASSWQYTFRDTAWPQNTNQTNTASNPIFLADSTGFFQIRQIASNSDCTDTAYQFDSVYIEQFPEARFSLTDTIACSPYKVTLRDSSVYDSLENGFAQWQLYPYIDTNKLYTAEIEGKQDTTLTLTDTGYYRVRLLAHNNQGCIDTMTKDSLIRVTGRPNPRFTRQTDTQCLKSEVNFKAQYTHAHNYQWNFGNGQTDTIRSPEVTYQNTGDYPIRLTASNEWCVDTVRDTVGILVEPFPQASFSAPDTGNCRPFEVNFDNQSQDAYDYTWLTDSNQFDTSELTHTYTDTGHFDVSLIVRNNQGCVDTQVKRDYIYSSPVPNAYFGKEDTVGCEYVAFDFRDSSTHANQWEWHFGNGDTGRQQHPSYTYTNEGQYDITLIASNDYCADTQTINNYIDIIQAPKPGFSIQYDQACTPLEVQVNNESTGQIDSFYYTFGNGQTSNQANPAVTYKQEQEYTIKQQLRGVTGCLTRDRMQLKVYEDPEADYTIADTQVFCHEKAFEFKNRSRPEKPPLDSGLLYEWYFGVPEDSVVRDTMQDPVQRYSQTGEYPVELITTNGLCRDSLEQYLTVNLRQKPELDFEVKDPALCTGQEIQLKNHTQHADSFVWDLGDDQVKTGKEIDHTYTDPGYYDLRLTAFSNEGCIDSLAKNQYLHVKAHPEADFDFSPEAGCAPLEVTFENQSQPDSQDQTYSWLTGTGKQFNQPELTYTYENPTANDYPVTLIADNENCADSLTQTIKVRGFDGASEEPVLTNVTVQNNKVIKLDWEAHPWAESYQIFRKAKGGTMQPVAATEATAFTDRQANVHENRYFYKVSGIDSCGNVSTRSNSGRNILLEGENRNNNVAELHWNPYEQWETDIREYELEKAGSPDQPDLLTVAHDTAHRDEDFFDPEIDSQYYQVHAIQKGNPDIRSTSNILGLPLNPKLHIPNAFSPDGDGLNDIFRVQATGVHNFSLKIFSRWGEKVFETTNPDKGWDGTHQGQKAPMGTYMYVIYGEGNGYEQFSGQGTVTLMR